jgi:adenylate kinase
LNKKRIILLGAPGVGKGTQAKRLKENFHWAHISTGDMLRDAVRIKSDVGIKAKAFMEKGELVPDDIIIQLVGDRFKKDDCRNGFMLDGFPRTVIQAEKLDSLLDSLNEKIDDVISIDVDPQAIIDRLSQRMVCNKCNTIAEPGKGLEIKKSCPVCDGGVLIRRKDDEPETVKRRLNVYTAQTRSLVQYYQGRGLLRSVNGLGEPDEIYQRVITGLGLS